MTDTFNMRQISFDPLDYELVKGLNNLTAKQARDELYRFYRRSGKKVHRWVLTNQLRK